MKKLNLFILISFLIILYPNSIYSATYSCSPSDDCNDKCSEGITWNTCTGTISFDTSLDGDSDSDSIIPKSIADSYEPACSGACGVWFPSYTGGSYAHCCGDDGSSDDFYYANPSTLSTSEYVSCRRCLNGDDKGTSYLCGNGRLRSTYSCGTTEASTTSDIRLYCFYGNIGCSASTASHGEGTYVCGNGFFSVDGTCKSTEDSTSSTNEQGYCLHGAVKCDDGDPGNGESTFICGNGFFSVSGDCKSTEDSTSSTNEQGYCLYGNMECTSSGGSDGLSTLVCGNGFFSENGDCSTSEDNANLETEGYCYYGNIGCGDGSYSHGSKTGLLCGNGFFSSSSTSCSEISTTSSTSGYCYTENVGCGDGSYTSPSASSKTLLYGNGIILGSGVTRTCYYGDITCRDSDDGSSTHGDFKLVKGWGYYNGDLTSDENILCKPDDATCANSNTASDSYDADDVLLCGNGFFSVSGVCSTPENDTSSELEGYCFYGNISCSEGVSGDGDLSSILYGNGNLLGSGDTRQCYHGDINCSNGAFDNGSVKDLYGWGYHAESLTTSKKVYCRPGEADCVDSENPDDSTYADEVLLCGNGFFSSDQTCKEKEDNSSLEKEGYCFTGDSSCSENFADNGTLEGPLYGNGIILGSGVTRTCYYGDITCRDSDDGSILNGSSKSVNGWGYYPGDLTSDENILCKPDDAICANSNNALDSYDADDVLLCGNGFFSVSGECLTAESDTSSEQEGYCFYGDMDCDEGVSDDGDISSILYGNGNVVGDFCYYGDINCSNGDFNNGSLCPYSEGVECVPDKGCLGPPGIVNIQVLKTDPLNLRKGSIRINWTDVGDFESGFNIYRSTDGINFGVDPYTSVDANILEYTDTNIDDNSEYYYYLTAFVNDDDGYETGPSDNVSGITEDRTAPPISTLTLNPDNTINNRMDLSWNLVSDEVQGPSGMLYSPMREINGRYQPILGLLDDFTSLDSTTYDYNGGISIDTNRLKLSRTSERAWGNDYYITKEEYDRTNGGILVEADVKGIGSRGDYMFGVFDTGTGTSYTDLVYAIYAHEGNSKFIIYEDGTSRGYVDYSLNSDKTYHLKILVKETGARYFIDDVLVYESSHSNENYLRAGITIAYQTQTMDDFKVSELTTSDQYQDDEAQDITAPNEVEAPSLSPNVNSMSVSWTEVSDNGNTYYYKLDDLDIKGNYNQSIDYVADEVRVDGVKYYVDETTGTSGGDDSGSWLNSNNYQDIGLRCNTEYSYRIRAKDEVDNIGSFSSSESKYTLVNAPNTPDVITISNTALRITWNKVCDYNNPEYYIDETSGNTGANNYGWETSRTYDDSGLNCFEYYTYKAKARNFQNVNTSFSSVSSPVYPIEHISGCDSTDGLNGFCWVSTTCYYTGTGCPTETTACSAETTTCCTNSTTIWESVGCTSTGKTGNDYDRDSTQERCESTASGCTAFTWLAGGESSAFGQYDTGISPGCCGDDSNENVRNCNGDTNSCAGSTDNTACCDNENDCVYDGVCYSHNELRVDSEYKCVSGSWDDIVAPTCDDLTLSESTNYAHTQKDSSITSSIWYNNASSGSFSVEVLASDAGTGIWKVSFPAVFDDGSSDDTSYSYSRSYDWAVSENDDEQKIVYIHDFSDNVNNSCTFDVILDNTAPNSTLTPNSYGWNNTDIDGIKLDCADNSGGSGCQTKYYNIIDSSDTCDTSSMFTYSTPFNVTCPDDNTCEQQICYYSKDNVNNNEGIVTSEEFLIDKTNPTYVSASFSRCNYQSGNTCWAKENDVFKIKISHSDDIEVKTQYLRYYDGSVDIRSFSDYDSYFEDLNTFVNDNYIDITGATCTDSDCTDTDMQLEWSSKIGADESNFDIYTFHKDHVENTLGYTNLGLDLNIDNKPPITTISPDGHDWINSDVSVSLSCTDISGSGCNNTYYKIVNSTTDCTTTTVDDLYAGDFDVTCADDDTCQKKVCYYSDDNVDNEESVKTSNTYYIDKIDPTCSVTSISESTNYTHTSSSSGWKVWYNSITTGSFIVNVDANDDMDGSSVDYVYFPKKLNSDAVTDSNSPYSGGYSWATSDTFSGVVSNTVYDVAGNTNTCDFTITRDVIEPTTSISQSSRDWNNTDISGISLSCTDNSEGSGCKNRYWTIINDGEDCPSAGDASYTTYSGEFSVTCASGNTCEKRVCYYSKDNVNNDETPNLSGIFKIDKTNPTYESVSINQCNYENGNVCWVKEADTFKIDITHSDDIEIYRQYLRFSGSDDIRSYSNYDSTFTDMSSYINNNYIDIQSVSCVDSDSDCTDNDLTLRWSSLTGASEGDFSIYTYHRDHVGNNLGYTDTGKDLKIDNTNPETTIDEDTSWSGADMTTTLDCTDSRSGCYRSYYKVINDGDTCGTTGFSLYSGSISIECNSDSTCQKRVCFYSIDNVGNQEDTKLSDVFSIDKTDPECEVISIDEGSSYAYAPDTKVWYNPDYTGSFVVNVDANDADSGVERVYFPTLLSSSSSNDYSDPYNNSYSWSTSDSYSGTVTLTVYDNVGNSNTCTFDVQRDDYNPLNGEMLYPDRFHTVDNIVVKYNQGEDNTGGSGLYQAKLQYKSATLTGESCGSFGDSWIDYDSNTNLDKTQTNVVGLVDDNCYQFRYAVTDQVSNTEYFTNPNVLKVKLGEAYFCGRPLTGPLFNITDGTNIFASVDSLGNFLIPDGSTLHETATIPTSYTNSLLIQKSTTPLYLFSQDDVYIKGIIDDNVSSVPAETNGDFVFKDLSQNLIANFNDNGNVFLKGFLLYPNKGTSCGTGYYCDANYNCAVN